MYILEKDVVSNWRSRVNHFLHFPITSADVIERTTLSKTALWTWTAFLIGYISQCDNVIAVLVFHALLLVRKYFANKYFLQNL